MRKSSNGGAEVEKYQIRFVTCSNTRASCSQGKSILSSGIRCNDSWHNTMEWYETRRKVRLKVLAHREEGNLGEVGQEGVEPLDPFPVLEDH